MTSIARNQVQGRRLESSTRHAELRMPTPGLVLLAYAALEDAPRFQHPSALDLEDAARLSLCKLRLHPLGAGSCGRLLGPHQASRIPPRPAC